MHKNNLVLEVHTPDWQRDTKTSDWTVTLIQKRGSQADILGHRLFVKHDC